MLLDLRSLWEGVASPPISIGGGEGDRRFISWGPRLRYRPEDPAAMLVSALALGVSLEHAVVLLAAAEDGDLIE